MFKINIDKIYILYNYILLLILIFIINSCGELIESGGKILNNLNLNDQLNKEVKVAITDNNNNYIPGFLVSIITSYDSTYIFTPKISKHNSCVDFNFGNEQLIPLNEDVNSVLLTVEHPTLGSYSEVVLLNNTNQENGNILINIPIICNRDTVTYFPLYRFKKLYY